MIVLSFDIDWALDEVVLDTLRLLESYDLPGTFFCTHQVGDDLQTALENGPHEIGLHPHMRGDDVSLTHSLQQLRSWYPDAVTARSHSLLSSTPILQSYRQHDIQYSSNTVVRRTPNLRPLPVQWGLLDVPIFEMDYFMLSESDGELGKHASDIVDVPGLKVFCFHPIHLFLNCRSLADYERARPAFDNLEELATHRNPGYGMRSYFEELLRQITATDLRIDTLATAVQTYSITAYG